MNLDNAHRASIAWRVIAATANILSDNMPSWEDAPAEIKSMVSQSINDYDMGDKRGSGLAAALTNAGWVMGRWDHEQRHCILASYHEGPGAVGWAGAAAALDALKEI